MLPPSDRAAVDRVLQQRESALLAAIAAATRAVRTDIEQAAAREVGDDAAQYAVRDELSVDRVELERAQAELADVRAARRAVADGHYGVCRDCAIAIAPARLAANPSALRCAACQQQYERAA